jgi:uncharacterized SAM-binding protein YcdF (DUF218 family)
MKKIFLCLLLCVVVLGAIVFNHRVLLTRYAELFSVHNAAPGADALVVLGGGVETRFPYAIELYRQGYADTILMTDLRSPNLGVPGLDCSQRKVAFALRDHYEPAALLLVVPSNSGAGAVSTFDEAWDLLVYSRAKGYKRIIIVTDAFHTRRALYAFRKVFEDSGVTVEAMGAPNAMFNEQNWWLSDRGLKCYVLEPMLLCVYFFTQANLPFLKNY